MSKNCSICQLDLLRIVVCSVRSLFVFFDITLIYVHNQAITFRNILELFGTNRNPDRTTLASRWRRSRRDRASSGGRTTSSARRADPDGGSEIERIREMLEKSAILEQLVFFTKMVHPRPLFRLFSGFFKQTLQQITAKKCPSSLQRQHQKSQPSDYESPP